MARQKRHIRRSKTGKPFLAGRGKAKPHIAPKVKREVLKDHADEVTKQLKQHKRARIPDLGILRLKIKPATKGGKKVTAFGKTYITKPKPRRAVIKFSAAQGLKTAVA